MNSNFFEAFVLMLLLLVTANAQNSTKQKQDDSAWIKLQEYYEHMIHNDWPNLSKYSDANAVLGLPTATEKRVIFMCNSITEGWLNTDSAFFKDNKYIDRGIGGQTTPQMLVRFRADVVNLKPQVVVILAGTNDIAGNTGPSTLEMIENNLASMTDLAKAHNIQVILCSVLPVYDYPWKPGLQPAEKIVALNAWIKKYADDNGCLYVDYWTPLADERKGMKAEYAKDGVHPTLEGYKVMELIVQQAIHKAIR
jgi:lysophospholipase L1-like esterase